MTKEDTAWYTKGKGMVETEVHEGRISLRVGSDRDWASAHLLPDEAVRLASILLEFACKEKRWYEQALEELRHVNPPGNGDRP